jgi:hypothetical protein
MNSETSYSIKPISPRRGVWSIRILRSYFHFAHDIKNQMDIQP